MFTSCWIWLLVFTGQECWLKSKMEFRLKMTKPVLIFQWKAGISVVAEMNCICLIQKRRKCFYAFFRGLFFFFFSHFGKVVVSSRITYVLWHYVFVVFCVFCTDAVRIYCYLDWYLSLPFVSPRKLNQIQS